MHQLNTPPHLQWRATPVNRLHQSRGREDLHCTYLTNGFTLPAYLIVLLYKNRWDIEKIFHQLNKQDE